MATYSVSNEAKIDGVIQQLRRQGIRAWRETLAGRSVICTEASTGLLAICSGDGLWATRLFAGLPG